MRFLQAFLFLAFLVSGSLTAGDLPTVKATLPDLALTKNTPAAPVVIPTVNLQTLFEVTGITGDVVQFESVLGTYNVEMAASSAPNTVANFLSYVDAGSYSNSIIHRSDQPLKIIQGGGFLADTSLSVIATGTAIALEVGDTLLNSRGTIAMARTGAPDSATSGWFINTGDNSVTLPPASANGYAVFGRVTGTGMSVADAIAARTVLNGNLTVTSSSSTSPTVAFSSAPPSFGPNWVLNWEQFVATQFETTVQSVTGNSITLASNARATISSPTPIPASRFGKPFNQLPIIGAMGPGPGGSVTLDHLVTFTGITRATVFPSTGGVTVTTSSTTTKVVTTTGIPVELGIGSTLLGSTVEAVAGNFVFLKDNANRTITTSTSVPVSKAGERNVVTFSVENTNPGLVAATVTGSALEMRLLNNRGGTASLVVKATDSNGNVAQIPFRITVTGGHSAPADVNADGKDDFVFQNNIGQIASWFLNGTGDAINFSTGGGVVPGSKTLYGSASGGWRLAARADVNSDGVPDLIFQNSLGQIYAWFLDGSGAAVDFTTGAGLKPGSKYLYTGGLGDWQIADVADVNGDGSPDVILQNNAGQLFAWFLDGSGNTVNFATGAGLKLGSKYLYTGGMGDWRLANCVDLDGDAKNDLLFQNTAGQIYAWFLDGNGNTTNSRMIYAAGLGDWRLVGCPDLNNDGRSDLVFQNTAGQIAAWFLDGTGNPVNFSTGGGLVPPVSRILYSAGLADWKIR